MSTELFGVVYLAIGVALLVWGSQLARLLLGLWGLGIGLWLGELITHGQNFTYSWTFLIIWGTGLITMLLAYSFYRLALAFLIGFTIFWFAAGLLNLNNLDASLIFFLSLTAGILAGLYALRSDLSYLLLMIVSAVVGAGYTISGVLILVDGTNVSNIGYGPLNLVLRQPTVWVLAWLALTIVGIAIQDGPRRGRLTSHDS